MTYASTDSEDQFGRLFLSLPWQVMETIYSYLPIELISDVLLHIPSLRSFIVEKYYREEITLYLIDPDGKGAFDAFYTPAASHLIGLDNIKKFLTENPDIVPKKYSVYPDEKYTGLEEVLRSFQDTLGKAVGLKIVFRDVYRLDWPERVDPSKQLMELIFSYRNLYSLRIWYHEGNLDLLPKSNLQLLILNTFDHVDLSCISLPPSLEAFELYAEADISSEIEDRLDYDDAARRDLLSYGDLVDLLWEIPTIPPYTRVSRCPKLAELTLNNCGLEYVDMALFPPSLEYLSTSCDRIYGLEANGPKTSWPQNLETLVLAHNHMNDEVIAEIEFVGWPKRLAALSLINNKITSLSHLTHLPDTLTELYLGYNHYLTNLDLVHDGSGYRIKNLPNSLETLTFSMCGGIRWHHLGESTFSQILQRLHFPPKLKDLNLSNCNLRTLASFAFPPSLERLDLSSNQLKNLNTYNCWSGSTQLLSWEDLVNLHTLFMDGNKIKTLKRWKAPRLLREAQEQFEVTKRLSPNPYLPKNFSLEF